MSEHIRNTPAPVPLSMISGGYYVITVQGHLDDQWADWFGDLAITHDENGVSILSGFVADQAALHGLLAQIRDLSLPLLSLNRQPPFPDVVQEQNTD